jgi:hypothetical protein
MPSRTRRADRWVAGALGIIGLVIGLGGADEFRYFGAATPQFWAGVLAAPAGAVAIAAAVQLWRRGSVAAPWVRVAAGALLVATLGGAALRVMGPPAILVGLIGAGIGGWWARRSRVQQTG